MNEDCIFCKIIRNELPATRIYEDDDVLAFMDIGPVAPGHALIIPKTHHDNITQTPDEVLQKLIVIVKQVAQAAKVAMHAEGLNVTQANGKTAGQTVPHIHFHVIPRTTDSSNAKSWRPGSYDDPDEMVRLAKLITDAMSQERGPH